MTAIAALPHRMKFLLVTFMSTRTTLYYGSLRLAVRMNGQCVRPDTTIVIEGFPRSANSTTVDEFLSRQPEPVQVAHHGHHAAQILRAIARGVPAVVLIRSPKAATL